MFAAKFPISQNPHGILYVYYTIIFLFLHFFAGKCEVNPFRSGVRLIGSKLVQCKVQAYLYIGSHLALEKKAEKILSRTCMFQKCVVLLHSQSKGDTVVS